MITNHYLLNKRKRSLLVAKQKISINNTNPILWMITWALLLIGPITASITIINKCPPSKIGIGKRLNNGPAAATAALFQIGAWPAPGAGRIQGPAAAESVASVVPGGS